VLSFAAAALSGFLSQTLQVVGALGVLAPFAAAQFGVLSSHSRVYLLLNLAGKTDTAVLRSIRVRDRLGARLRNGKLDRALAGGACPDTIRPPLVARRGLISRRTQQQLSEEIQRLLRDAERRRHRLDWNVTDPRVIVGEVRALLQALADRLLSGGPVRANGVASNAGAAERRHRAAVRRATHPRARLLTQRSTRRPRPLSRDHGLPTNSEHTTRQLTTCSLRFVRDSRGRSHPPRRRHAAHDR